MTRGRAAVRGRLTHGVSGGSDGRTGRQCDRRPAARRIRRGPGRRAEHLRDLRGQQAGSAELVVYGPALGTVVRCRHLDSELMVFDAAPRPDLRGAVRTRQPGLPGRASGCSPTGLLVVLVVLVVVRSSMTCTAASSAVAPPPSIPVSRARPRRPGQQHVAVAVDVLFAATSRPARGSGSSSRRGASTSASVSFSSQDPRRDRRCRPALPRRAARRGTRSPPRPRSAYCRPADQRSGAATPRSSGSSPGLPSRVSLASRTS